MNDPDDDDDDELAREAEAAGQEDAEDDYGAALATPYPGMSFDPLFGVAGVGALGGRAEQRVVLEGRWPGEVLLEVPGRRPGVGGLLATSVGFLLVAGIVTGMSLAHDADWSRWIPWPTLRSVGCSWVLWVAAFVLLAAALAVRTLAQGADVTFTSEGVGTSGKGGASFVPWSEVRGYRPGEVLVLECEGGHLVVSGHDEERRELTLGLLDGRGVPRLE
ncbi:MAG: hypothetical protein KF878_05260 [Planctomycetes bacterium]|nr:hypothetical protein [Planctomycetota bacterium]